MMTRKDYIRTAEILQNAIQHSKNELEMNSKEMFFAQESVQFIAEQFAEFFANDNPRFNEEKFFNAVWSELNV